MSRPSPTQTIPTRENESAFLPRVVVLSPLTALLLAQAAVFAAAVASGKIPPAVLILFRALLTL